MKKAFVLFCALFALVACNVGPLDVTSAQDENQEIKFNFTVTRADIEGQTKATVKSGWASGDVVFVFFNGVGDGKYLEVKYDGSNWVCTRKNGLQVSDLSVSGTLTAVFLPYGSALTVSDDSGSFVFSDTYSGHFYYQEGVSYTFNSETMVLAATIKLAAAVSDVANDLLVHFDVSGYQSEHAYDLYQDYMKPIQFTGVSSTGSVNKSVGEKGDAITGYVDAANSILSFSGVLDASAYNTEKDYQFSINDVTASVLYTRDAGNKTLSANKYIGLGVLSNTTTWNANEYVDLGIVNVKGEKVMWAKKNLGATAESGEGSYGKYYAWGELEGYALSGTYPAYTCSHIFANDANEIPLEHFMNIKEDNSSTTRKTLKPEYDPAHVAMKGLWRMPTGYNRTADGLFEGELARLKDNTTKALTGNKGSVNLGITFTGNGNTIFLPLAGYVHGTEVHLNDNADIYVANYISSTCACSWEGGNFHHVTNAFFRLCNFTTAKSFSVTSSDESSGIGFTIRPVFSIK